MNNTISILGSTGSIGTQALEVAHTLGLSVSALAAGRNTVLLERQARQFRPALAAVFEASAAADLRIRLRDTSVRVVSGMEGLIEAAVHPAAGTVLTAMVGTVGLAPTLAAIRAKKRLALANKETLVCAGALVMNAARESGAEILPVDSEHSAIFQCLAGNRRSEVVRLILTASGGPFRGKTAEALRRVTKEDALRHPNWRMGPKITIDSATMMNKGLELIEAMHLFHMPPEQIDILIHPQSIVHSMVEYTDHSVIAQMGMPDMKLPIQLAFTWPARLPCPAPPLDLTQTAALTFEKPDTGVFRCLDLAMHAARAGGLVPAVMNAANEAAVALFLADQIPFPAIYERVAAVVGRMKNKPAPSLEEILAADQWARKASICI